MPAFVSHTNERFWKNYYDLPSNIQELAVKSYGLFQENPEHPSLHFKKVGNKSPIYFARVTDGYRALCYLQNNTAYWFWIGNHDAYLKMIAAI